VIKYHVIYNKVPLKINFVYILFLISAILSCSSSTSKVKYDEFSPANNLAYNDGRFLYPSPVESDAGWGGGNWCWHIVDGLRVKGNDWRSGLAFTGGSDNYVDTCGLRQITIDFGKPVAFNRIVVFHMWGNIPDKYSLLKWNEKTPVWDTIQRFQKDLNAYGQIYSKNLNLNFPVFVEDTFETVSSRILKYTFNNCNMNHGWIIEFEVYCDMPGDRPRCLMGRLLE
jgi:hypothetical protein